MSYNIDLMQDQDGYFHYLIFVPGKTRGERVCCGQAKDVMRKVAWFEPGDPRGAVHFERACETCLEYLSVLFDSLELST